jgi:hypothetical protein
MILGEEDKPSLDELAHHGVKGMKWGSRRGKSESVSSAKPNGSEIHAARARHNDRMDRLETEGARLSFAKSASDKQRVLNGIHAIANEKGAHEDANVATRLTRGEKIANTIVSGGLSTAVASRSMKKQGREAHDMLNAYKNSTVSDYHDASK